MSCLSYLSLQIQNCVSSLVRRTFFKNLPAPFQLGALLDKLKSISLCNLNYMKLAIKSKAGQKCIACGRNDFEGG
jgi:hypothetical protein